jgi:hypothetical protein
MASFNPRGKAAERGILAVQEFGGVLAKERLQRFCELFIDECRAD